MKAVAQILHKHKTMNQTFPWKRFWCPPDGEFYLDNSGYLDYPEGEYGKYCNPNLVSFDEIQHIPCLILLGEPGIGKSQALEDIRENLKDKISANNEHILSLDLKEYGSEDRLYRDLFESDVWREFKDSNNRLHIFIDSLDEVRLRIPQVTALLLSGLKGAPTGRLLFRITCRTAEWPWSFKEDLSKLWKEEQVRVYELVPLRLIDIQKASKLAGINAAKFIASVGEKNAGSLAARPITLNFLLNLFKNDGGFPASKAELYKKGCLCLCRESDLSRREKEDADKRYVGFLTPEQRLAIASRIAAALIFSNRFAAYTDIDDISDTTNDVVKISELIGGKEIADKEAFEAGKDSVKETLKTGLFTSRGAHLMGFAHQSYAEFLAARYLENAPLEQIKSLLTHSYDSSKIIPQLHETAAWVVGQRTDLLPWIISNEPEILLRGDVARVDDATKRNLVLALFNRFIEEDLLDNNIIRDNYKKLAYPELHKQLGPIIKDKSILPIPRRVAIDIAEACDVKELQEALVEIALDQTDDYHIRAEAASVVWKIADNEIKKRLESLAKGERGPDPNDQLRGYGLRCMWPKHWNTVELLKNIIKPQKHFIGAYIAFLQFEFIPQLPTPDLLTCLPEALDIIETWPYVGGQTDLLGIISDEIVLTAWSTIPDYLIMKKLLKLFFSRNNKYQPICDKKVWESLVAEDGKRYEIIKYMVEEFEINDEDCRLLISSSTPLILDKDFPWLLGQIENFPQEKQKLLAVYILHTLRYDYPTEWINAFLEVRLRVPILQEIFPISWELDSEPSRNSKEIYLRRLRTEEQNKQRAPEPSIIERTEASLAIIEDGNIDEWINLCPYLSVNQKTGDIHECPSKIQDTPGWKTSNEFRRRRIKEAALEFIKRYIPEGDDWFGKGSYSWPVISTYLAIRLIAEDKEVVDSISNDCWIRLVPFMVDCPAFNDQESHSMLFNLAYKKAPVATRKYLMCLIDNQNERHGRIFFIDYLKECWNAELSPSILEKLSSNTLKPESLRDLIEFLFEIGVPNLHEVVVGKIIQLRNEDGSLKEILIESIALLIRYWSREHWSLIWEIFQEQSELADEALGKVAGVVRHGLNFIDSLSESNLADLYFYMSKRYPQEEDPRLHGSVTTRHNLSDLRSSLLLKLVNKGTKEACAEIKTLVERLPEQRPWIVWKLNEAQHNTLRKSWVPPEPSQIIALFSDRNKRYVENEEQLLSVILESLHRMQEYYKGELTPLERLWNYQGAGNNRKDFKPKDEESLSDEVAIWLKDDLGSTRGIIVNREVQLRRGQKTDIYINAIKLGAESESHGTLTVVIEVKGCWHDNLLSDIENQLANHYMRDNNWRYGLYLVGWYLCDKWDDGDYRKSKTPRKTIEELRGDLENCAGQIKKLDHVGDLKPFVLDLSFSTV